MVWETSIDVPKSSACNVHLYGTVAPYNDLITFHPSLTVPVYSTEPSPIPYNRTGRESDAAA